MKKINVFFEADRNEKDIEVTIRSSSMDEEVTALIDRINGRLPGLLTVAGDDGALIRIAPEDIISVSVSGKTVNIVTDKERYSVRQSLQSLEERLEQRKS